MTDFQAFTTKVGSLFLAFLLGMNLSAYGQQIKSVNEPIAPVSRAVQSPTVKPRAAMDKSSRGKDESKNQSQREPKVFPQGKQLFMQFPEDVQDVVVFDDKGKALQRFRGGRKFDITESLIKTNAGTIKVGFAPKPNSMVPRRLDLADLYSIPLRDYRHLARAQLVLKDPGTVESIEPANNSINGAPLISAGYVQGDVGGDDTTDFCKVSVPGSGAGTLVRLEVQSGRVELFLYDPRGTYLNGGVHKMWIALAPGATFFFEVRPTGFTAVSYRVSIAKTRLDDAYEANDSLAQAKTFGAGRAFLGNVINLSGNQVGFNDFYKVRITESKNVRISVTNAGLAPGGRVAISLYDANGTHITTEDTAGSAGGCVFTYDLRPDWAGVSWPVFPAGDWRILVSDSGTTTEGSGSPSAHGTGDPPAAYTQSSGYFMTTSLTP